MYDKYPEHDVPQQNIVQMFFSQRWSAILIEMALVIVVSTAAGRAFDFFDPIDVKTETPPEQTAIDGIPIESIKAYGLDYIRQGKYVEAKAVYDLMMMTAPQHAQRKLCQDVFDRAKIYDKMGYAPAAMANDENSRKLLAKIKFCGTMMMKRVARRMK